MFTNIFLILIGGSLLFLMFYSFYLVLFSKSDKASLKQPNITESQTAKQRHQPK